MKRLVGVIAVLCVSSGAAAQQQPPRSETKTIETKTVELKHLKPTEAVKLLRPYIVSGAGGVFDVSETIPIITIKDFTENIERMERVLAKYDHSPATVRLVFQLIEADTGNRLIAASNPRSQIPVELDSTLRSVLRFPVYRLISQGVSSTGENAMLRQALGDAGEGLSYFLQATVGAIRIRDAQSAAPTGTVNLDVYLGREIGVTSGSGNRPTETLLTTRLDVPLGNTVVLGTAATRINGVALILTVRPELVRADK